MEVQRAGTELFGLRVFGFFFSCLVAFHFVYTVIHLHRFPDDACGSFEPGSLPNVSMYTV